MGLFVRLGRFRLNQQKRVIEDHISATQLKPFKRPAILTIGRAEEVSSGCPDADRLEEDVPALEARQVEIAQCVFEEAGARCDLHSPV